jgi:hypothetical protein
MKMEVEHTGQWKTVVGDQDSVHRGLTMSGHLHQPFLEQYFIGEVFIGMMVVVQTAEPS